MDTDVLRIRRIEFPNKQRLQASDVNTDGTQKNASRGGFRRSSRSPFPIAVTFQSLCPFNHEQRSCRMKSIISSPRPTPERPRPTRNRLGRSGRMGTVQMLFLVLSWSLQIFCDCPTVVEVSTSKTGKHGHAKCHFVAIDIFNAKKLEDIVPSSHNCDVPHVTRTDYQLIDISEDGFVSLLTENGNTKDDLKLPTDENLVAQLKDGFAEGKDLVVTVMSAMGEEQICALKDIGPK
ncbi:hypothetical protein OPV22_023025 [Ensete ventricosum]|uniref:Translation initiation factor 5A C-terminal domain-containing protein n=1 Tax=Ensete ventricosum TaxID=4639 RepID=A0AAV8QPR5_ENSVE|nr:hypothetical protein OPV22_023025 [Ensete ventricosum]